MELATRSFWLCFLVAAYTYVLYPVLLSLIYVFEQIRSDCAYLARQGCQRKRLFAGAGLPLSPLLPSEEKLPAG